MTKQKKEKFNQADYIKEWKKKNRKQFKVDLSIAEYEKICNLLKKKNLSKVQFIKDAYEELLKK